MLKPTISICIPTYKRVHLLPRLLDSIERQDYKDYEVIVNNNSEEQRLEEICKEYASRINIKYYKNPVELSAGANWNRCMDLCTGEWVKVMHDDDWFVTDEALSEFAQAAEQKKKFIWCGWTTKNENTGEEVSKLMTPEYAQKIIDNPFLLFGHNTMGPPSCIMTHHTIKIRYDVRMTWLVDIDLFINILLQEKEAVYINRNLVYFSYNSTQLTNTFGRNKGTEISESLMIWEKHKYDMIRNAINFDAWWRIIRNLDITSTDEFAGYAKGLPVPPFIDRMINIQHALPKKLTRIPVVSKLLMLYCYLFFYRPAK